MARRTMSRRVPSASARKTRSKLRIVCIDTTLRLYQGPVKPGRRVSMLLGPLARDDGLAAAGGLAGRGRGRRQGLQAPAAVGGGHRGLIGQEAADQGDDHATRMVMARTGKASLSAATAATARATARARASKGRNQSTVRP